MRILYLIRENDCLQLVDCMKIRFRFALASSVRLAIHSIRFDWSPSLSFGNELKKISLNQIWFKVFFFSRSSMLHSFWVGALKIQCIGIAWSFISYVRALRFAFTNAWIIIYVQTMFICGNLLGSLHIFFVLFFVWIGNSFFFFHRSLAPFVLCANRTHSGLTARCHECISP